MSSENQDINALEDVAEKDFRSKRLWHSFKAALYGSISAAAFTGVLIKLVGLAVDAFQPGSNAGSVFGNVGSMAMMGGLAALGTAVTYLAQIEWTEMQCLNDEHLARKNAECLQKQQNLTLPLPAFVPQAAVEYPQNCRADGKDWGPEILSKQSNMKVLART